MKSQTQTFSYLSSGWQLLFLQAICSPAIESHRLHPIHMNTQETSPEEPVYFDELPLNDDVIDGITAMGFEKATPIQAAAIPPILEGKDVIGIAQTGTGKTAAFLIPTLHRLMENPERKGIGALIIVPTRELAVQIDQAMEGLSYYTGLSSKAIYGGGDGMGFSMEKKALTEGVDVVIATPGRLLSHINLGYVPLDSCPVLILDEADRMLDMGFYQDIVRIINQTNENRQTLLFSATMPDNILNLTRQFQRNPVTVNIALSKPAEGVNQQAYVVFGQQKVPLLAHILKSDDWKSVIVFASTKKAVSEVTRALVKKGVKAREISSDLEQKEREEVLLEFRNRKLPVLVATNVVARGIDIDDIEMVVNIDVPRDAEDYVHRIGRTARASRTGTAITFIGPEEQVQFYRIEQLIGQTVNKLEVPNEFGEAPAYDPRPGSGRTKGRSNDGNNRGSKPRHKSGGQSNGQSGRGGSNKRRRNNGGSDKPRQSQGGQNG